MQAPPQLAARPALAAVPLGRVLGVPVELGASWWLLASLLVATYGPVLARVHGAPGGAAAALAFPALLLLSVVLHELGHCVAARLLRLRVRRVRVSFLAGVTEVVDAPRTPSEAYTVAVAGPLVSLLLTGLATAAARSLGPGPAGALAALVALSNGGLALFNLLPGLPLDGGGLLRSLVWRLTGDPHRATVVSAQSGRALAVGVLPLALVLQGPGVGPRLTVLGLAVAALVAAFLWTGATAALVSARLGRAGGPTAGSLARAALLVEAALPLAEALRRASRAGRSCDVVVVVDSRGAPSALLDLAAVTALPAPRRADVPVGSVVRPLCGPQLDPSLPVAALGDLVRVPVPGWLVGRPGEAVRVLRREDVAGALRTASPTLARS